MVRSCCEDSISCEIGCQSRSRRNRGRGLAATSSQQYVGDFTHDAGSAIESIKHRGSRCGARDEKHSSPQADIVERRIASSVEVRVENPSEIAVLGISNAGADAGRYGQPRGGPHRSRTLARSESEAAVAASTSIRFRPRWRHSWRRRAGCSEASAIPNSSRRTSSGKSKRLTDYRSRTFAATSARIPSVVVIRGMPARSSYADFPFQTVIHEARVGRFAHREKAPQTHDLFLAPLAWSRSPSAEDTRALR